MVLAELETYLSRPIAPTRRVALGDRVLPVQPAPGFGGVLLGGIVAHFARQLDEDQIPELIALTHELEHARRIPQPRLRHRLQQDRIGLQACTHRLRGHGEEVVFDLDEERGTPGQHVLCAIYAAGGVPAAVRSVVLSTVRTGLSWRGDTDAGLVAALSGHAALGRMATALGNPVQWAMEILDLREDRVVSPSRRRIQQAFRASLRDVHPDHGAGASDAALRIAELTEARRILLGQ